MFFCLILFLLRISLTEQVSNWRIYQNSKGTRFSLELSSELWDSLNFRFNFVRIKVRRWSWTKFVKQGLFFDRKSETDDKKVFDEMTIPRVPVGDELVVDVKSPSNFAGSLVLRFFYRVYRSMFTLQKIIRSRVKRQTPPEGFPFEIDQLFLVRWKIDRRIRSFVVTNFKALAYRKRRLYKCRRVSKQSKIFTNNIWRIDSIWMEKSEERYIDNREILEKYEESNKSACFIFL